jgi:hypothetical protein
MKFYNGTHVTIVHTLVTYVTEQFILCIKLAKPPYKDIVSHQFRCFYEGIFSTRLTV